GNGIAARPNLPASNSSANGTISRSASDFPTSRPAARSSVFAMPPPKISSSVFAASARSTSSLPDTFAPPTIAASGRFGASSAVASASSSATSNGPAHAIGAYRATPVVLACARCAVPNASITNTSQSAASRLPSAGSSFFSPGSKRTFSQRTRSPGATSTPSSQLVTSGTLRPRSSPSASATGASENAGSRSPSFGLPRCDITMTRAPASSACFSVGTAASRRAVLVTLPSLIGAFRSSRISTRRSRSGSSVIFSTASATAPLLQLRERERRVEHAVREAPLVVVPRADLHEALALNLRERRVVDRGGRVVIEVDRDQRLLGVLEHALQGALRGLAHRRIQLVGRGVASGLERQVHDRDVDRRHAHREAVEPAVELGQHEADRRGRAGLRRDHRLRRGARAAQVLVIDVGQHLVVRVRVHGRHQPVLDAAGLVQHLRERRETV